jgi:chromate reductase, NAD(P)H dehydrogenase (quinone)
MTMKNLFVIIGSASNGSSNEKLVDAFARLTEGEFNLTVFKDLKTLPHFDPEQSINNPPQSIIGFRNQVEQADGILICTPEYVFSIPSGLKNVIEWCVSTTVFSDKPVGIITASADGQKGHEELQLIMKTVMARFTKGTALLIRGVKGKMNEQGEITDSKTRTELMEFVDAFRAMINEGSH